MTNKKKMDISKIIKRINNLDEYISITQDITNKYSNSKIQLNMSTVLALKKIKFLEIEFFKKYEKNGVALIVLEQILLLPPSQTWGLLGVELISLLQYWLDALRKQIIVQNNSWWNFVSAMLNLIEKIRHKSPTMNNILVQDLAECLLHVATHQGPDLAQRHQVLRCLNLCCADCSREIRIDLRNRLNKYFIKLSSLMSCCGDVATQYSIMETLLRWLVPRQDLEQRRRAAAEWFPDGTYSRRCVEIFLERKWRNFFQDARDFLNAFNEASGLVVSVIIRRFSVGNVSLVANSDNKQYWLDLNTSSECVSLMLEPRLQETLQVEGQSCDTLVITPANVEKMYIRRQGSEVRVAVVTVDPQLLCASPVLVEREVRLVLCAPEFDKLDLTLRTMFTDKYVVIPNDGRAQVGSARVAGLGKNSGVKRAGVQPARASFSTHSGYVVIPRVPQSWQSPSTASTTSLAMLREKLTAFSRLDFDKQPVSVCAVPQLSHVTELTETEDRRSLNSLSTLKLKSYGVAIRRQTNAKETIVQNRSESTPESRGRGISPIVEDEDSVSCLLVATIGSADDGVINHTLERLPKDKDIHTDNIIDLLAKEALQYKQTRQEGEVDTRVVNNNYIKEKVFQELESSKTEIFKKPHPQTVISNSTTDDSNLEVIENTPIPSNLNEGCNKNKEINEGANYIDDINIYTEINQLFDCQSADRLFSQHTPENANTDIVISPTLVRNLNRSSSESSEEFDLLLKVDQYLGIDEASSNFCEVSECLNNVVDKVCNKLEVQNKIMNDSSDTKVKPLSVKPLTKNFNNNSNCKKEEGKKRNVNKTLKLKLKPKKTTKSHLQKQTLVLEQIRETLEVEENNSPNENTNPIKYESPKYLDACKSPRSRRKRKLYSPKDDEIMNKKVSMVNESTCSHNSSAAELEPTGKPYIYNDTPYKEIENIRRKSTRKIRNKIKEKTNESISPRLKQLNDVFDSLKYTKEDEKNIVLVERNSRGMAVYNFSSDSDDEDFRHKEVNNKKRRVVDSKKSSAANMRKNSTRTRSKRNKKKKPKTSIANEQISEPIFDQMRAESSGDHLERSLICDKEIDIVDNDPEPIINKPLHMEVIENDEIGQENLQESKKKNKRKNYKNKKTETARITRSSANKLNVTQANLDEINVTTSPLPGLVIEVAPSKKNNNKNPSSITMLDELNDISEAYTNWQSLNNLHDIAKEQREATSNMEITQVEPIHNVDELQGAVEENIIHMPVKAKDYKVKKNKFNLTTSKKAAKGRDRTTQDVTQSDSQTLNTGASKRSALELRSNNSNNSIVTTGKSPITAHGNSDESPPNVQQLSQRIVDERALEVQDVNSTLKDYFKNLNNQINSDRVSSTTSVAELSKTPAKCNSTKRASTVNMSPQVVITRLSPKEINKSVLPRYNSVFCSEQSSDNSVVFGRESSIKGISVDVDFESTSNHTKNVQLDETKENHNLTILSVTPNIIYSPVKNNTLNCDENPVERKVRTTRDSKLRSSPRARRHLNVAAYKNRLHYDIGSVQQNSSPQRSLPKRNKDIENAGSSMEVLLSGSSVQEWLDRHVSKDTARTRKTVEPYAKENIAALLEKLDTTLQEIHHNTNKRFANMLLEAQKDLHEMVVERQRMYKDGARGALVEMVKVMDAKLTEIDERSHKLDKTFMSNLKERASRLLGEDRKQKSDMVALLREDLLAAHDYAETRDRATD